MDTLPTHESSGLGPPPLDSRVHGKPNERVENVTALHDPLDVAAMTRKQRDGLKRELLRQHPELVERIAGIRASV